MSSEHTGSSAKKFPYLVIPNTPLENIEGVFPTRRVPNPKRDGSARVHTKNDRHGVSRPKSELVSYLEDPYHNSLIIPAGHVQMTEINNMSMSQMKAILTAQKELRKPASSLYPSSSQISLIPETELIYRKYFPNDGNDTKGEGLLTSPPKVLEKDKRGMKSNIEKDRDISKPKVRDGIKTTSAASSMAECNFASNDCNNNKCKVSEKKEVVGRTIEHSNQSVKPTDAEIRFRKRLQAQVVSLCAEMERHSADIIEVKKELKEVLQMSRQNVVDITSSKSRLDTLSKHVNEIENKIDSIQASAADQEKSLLNKLMLVGEISDTDSELDETTGKGFDTFRCPSSTKLSAFSSNTKRPLSSGSLSDGLPKSCHNWVPIAPDFDKLLQAVALLNYRMDRNQSMKLCTTNNGATFKHSDVTDLTIFKNGIIVGSTGFRSYSTMSVKRFVNELFNGYLPMELSTQYPDGVVLVVTDKRSFVYSCDENFRGCGCKLSYKDPPDLLPGKLNILQRKDSMESLKASTTASLNSLRVTSSITSVVSSISNSYEMLPDLKTLGQSDTPVTTKEQKLIMLKINDQSNGRRYKLRVCTNATIKAVTDHLRSAVTEKDDIAGKRGSCSKTSKSYDVILPVPHGKLSCTNVTLEDYGITQNTLVYIQERKI